MWQYNLLIALILILLTIKYNINPNGTRGISFKMNNRKRRISFDNLTLIICFLYYFIIYSFRNFTVGTDLKNYLIRYHAFAITPFKEIFKLADHYSFEYGFAIFVKVLTYISDSALFFMIVTGAIISFGFYRYIKKYSNDVLFSFLIFFTFSMGTGAMNVVRQYLAIVILLASIDYIEKNKLFKFSLFVLLATTIHTGSVVFIVLYPLIKLTKLDARYVLAVLGGTLVIVFLGDKLLYPIIGQTSFAWYIGRSGSGESMLFFSVVLTLLLFLWKKKDGDMIEREKIWFDMMMLSIIFNAAALHLGLFERVMRFFYPALIILVPNTLSDLSIKKMEIKKVTRTMLIIFFVLFFAYIMYTGNGNKSGGTYPYEFMDLNEFNNDALGLYNLWYK